MQVYTLAAADKVDPHNIDAIQHDVRPRLWYRLCHHHPWIKRAAAMPLTHDFKQTNRDRVQRDSKFRKKILRICLEAMLSGDITLAKTILRDYINITVDSYAAECVGNHQPDANRTACERAVSQSSAHSKVHVAGQSAVERCHLDRAGGRAAWYGGCDFGTRYHPELSRLAIESHTGGAGQIVAQDNDGHSHLAGGGQGFHERPQSRTQEVDRATAKVAASAAGSAFVSCPIEVAVGSLHQPIRDVAVSARKTALGAKAVERG